MADPALLRMPLHLLSIVLSQLDNIQSLASAIHSHSSLYAAYNEDRDTIVRTIIGNQIPDVIMEFYAFPTYLSSFPDLDRSDIDRLSDILTCSHDFPYIWRNCSRAEGRLPINRHLASTISRTHTIIEHFTRDLLEDSLPLVRKHLGLRRRDCSTASDDEVFRIQRAMYRFQLYCNLFQYPYTRKQIFHRLGPILHVYFFNPFSPWVNEQLACIHDYFERVLSRTFDEVAAHDVEWGYKSVNWLHAGKCNEHKQGFLFHGLEFLYNLHRAETYTEKREILRAFDEPLPRTNHMLGGRFTDGSTFSDIDDWHWYWQHIDVSKVRIINGRPVREYWVDIWTNEPDVYGSGPFRMWREAHNDCWREDVINHVDNDWLRRCGYVLWDAPETPISDRKLRKVVDEARRQGLLDYFRRHDGDVKTKMKRSRKERADIYLRGGRGYWSEGDLSQIVWSGLSDSEEPSPAEPSLDELTQGLMVGTSEPPAAESHPVT